MLKTHFDAISERVGGVFERGTNETRMIKTQSNNFYHKMSAIDDLKAIDDDNDNSLPLDK
ncbi:hypothetical protein Tco_1331964, partial [Tanacetum coccineum]